MDLQIDMNSQRRWDDSLLTKEEEDALCSSKRMAAIKRERIKEYTFSNRVYFCFLCSHISYMFTVLAESYFSNKTYTSKDMMTRT